MRAAVHVGAGPAVEAHREALLLAVFLAQLEANAPRALGERRRFADQPFVASHRCSSDTVAQRARAGRVASRPASCAPYDTATASTPALAASSTSCVVSPTMRARRGSTPVMSINLRSM